MQRELLLQAEEAAVGAPADDGAPRELRRMVAVSLVMGTSGARTVSLPLEAVDGRTVREVVNAAAAALRHGDIADQAFGESALHLFADATTAVHHIMGPDQDRPLARSARVSVTVGEPLTFALYVDHIGGAREGS